MVFAPWVFAPWKLPVGSYAAAFKGSTAPLKMHFEVIPSLFSNQMANPCFAIIKVQSCAEEEGEDGFESYIGKSCVAIMKSSKIHQINGVNEILFESLFDIVTLMPLTFCLRVFTNSLAS